MVDDPLSDLGLGSAVCLLHPRNRDDWKGRAALITALMENKDISESEADLQNLTLDHKTSHKCHFF